MPDVDVAVYRGISIQYDTDRRQFHARIGSREIRKSVQRDLEKMILHFQQGTTCAQGLLIDLNWYSFTVQKIDVVGSRGGKIKYKDRDNLESVDADRVYVFCEDDFSRAMELKKEYMSWQKRFDQFKSSMRKIDLESLK